MLHLRIGTRQPIMFAHIYIARSSSSCHVTTGQQLLTNQLDWDIYIVCYFKFDVTRYIYVHTENWSSPFDWFASFPVMITYPFYRKEKYSQMKNSVYIMHSKTWMVCVFVCVWKREDLTIGGRLVCLIRQILISLYTIGLLHTGQTRSVPPICWRCSLSICTHNVRSKCLIGFNQTFISIVSQSILFPSILIKFYI